MNHPFIVALLAGAVTLGLLSCSASVELDPASEAAITEATWWLGAEPPASATNLMFQELEPGIDDAAVIRFDLPADEVDAFLTEFGFGRVDAGRIYFGGYKQPEWFVTDDLTDFAGASTGVNRFPALQTTIDLSDDDTSTLYILALEF